MISKEIAEKNEKDFQRAFSTWEASGYQDKTSYQQMFTCIMFAAENIIKAKLKVFRDDVSGLAADLTMLVFERDIIKRHIRPNKLSSYLFLPLQGIMYGAQRQFEEKALEHDIQNDRDLSSPEEEMTKENVFVVYDKVYKKSKEIYTKDDEINDLKERDSVKVAQVITEDMIRNPDFVMSLFGWEIHN